MICKVCCSLQCFIWALKSFRSKILFREFWVSFKDSSLFSYGLILNDLWRKAIMIGVLLSYVKPKSRNVPCDCWLLSIVSTNKVLIAYLSYTETFSYQLLMFFLQYIAVLLFGNLTWCSNSWLSYAVIMRSRAATLRCPVTRKYDWNEFRISKALKKWNSKRCSCTRLFLRGNNFNSANMAKKLTQKPDANKHLFLSDNT